jgi:anthranilate phosphoribosyltransferase
MASFSLTELTDQLNASLDLQPEQVELAAGALAAPEVSESDKVIFLTAFSTKGETAAEVAAFARAFQARAVDPGLGEWSAGAIDIVGTGGDHAGGFNISSLVVLTLASAGVKVMKHGNRGITSKCGSADLLAGLGVDLGASPEKLRRAVAELGYVYLLAPNYHPAFKHIAPVRKALAARGQRTVFNILGPLINPARPAHTVLGVYSAAWVPRMAGALEAMGSSAGLVVHGVISPEQGIDELTTATRNLVRGAGRMRAIEGEWHAGDFGIKPAPFAELQGGDVEANLAITKAILEGRGPRGLTDTIVLNTAVGLWICGRMPDVRSGIAPARDLLLGGAVATKVAATREFYAS